MTFRFTNRITILTGHFGSGKTELAIHLSLAEKKHYPKVAIADLDIINPYFRTRDTRTLLESNGVEVIAPPEKLAFTDLPIVTGGLSSILQDSSYRIVIDLGGDRDGAVAVGQFAMDLVQLPHDMVFVLNIARPAVNTPEKVIETIREIEQSSRLKVSGIINNTNLGGSQTPLEMVKQGAEVAKQVSKLTDIPFLFTAMVEELAPKAEATFTNDPAVSYITRRLKVPWEM